MLPLTETTGHSDLRSKFPLEITDGSVPQSHYPSLWHTSWSSARDRHSDLSKDGEHLTGVTLFFNVEIIMDIRWLSLLKTRSSCLFLFIRVKSLWWRVKTGVVCSVLQISAIAGRKPRCDSPVKVILDWVNSRNLVRITNKHIFLFVTHAY